MWQIICVYVFLNRNVLFMNAFATSIAFDDAPLLYATHTCARLLSSHCLPLFRECLFVLARAAWSYPQNPGTPTRTTAACVTRPGKWGSQPTKPRSPSGLVPTVRGATARAATIP